MTIGQHIYASISPFMFSKHTLSRAEAEKMVAKSIDTQLEIKDKIIKKQKDALIEAESTIEMMLREPKKNISTPSVMMSLSKIKKAIYKQ